MRCLLIFLIFFANTCFTYSQESRTNILPPGDYKVGYTNIVTTDTARQYKPNAQPSDKLFYRPLEIDVWYPAMVSKTDKEIQFGDLLNLFERRANEFQDEQKYKGISTELAKYISSNLNLKDSEKLLDFKTNTYQGAKVYNSKFPLIIYMTAFNGMSYENINLFEFLASHGYIIASMSSVGRYPGDMTTKTGDIMEQVYDAAFAINYLKEISYIDSTKIGAIGYSWGGLAASILAMNNKAIKAVLSLDGSEMHYYGESKEEDQDFDDLKKSVFLMSKTCIYPMPIWKVVLSKKKKKWTPFTISFHCLRSRNFISVFLKLNMKIFLVCLI